MVQLGKNTSKRRNETMGTYEKDHLEAWLSHAAYDDERDELRERIVAYVEENPDALNEGWPTIRRKVC